MLLPLVCRKTGVTLKDTGVRDEHGMQPLEDIFSSPEKESQNGFDEDDSSEDASMDIDESELANLHSSCCHSWNVAANTTERSNRPSSQRIHERHPASPCARALPAQDEPAVASTETAGHVLVANPGL